MNDNEKINPEAAYIIKKLGEFLSELPKEFSHMSAYYSLIKISAVYGYKLNITMKDQLKIYEIAIYDRLKTEMDKEWINEK